MNDWSDPLAVWDGRPTDEVPFDPPVPSTYDGRDGSIEISREDEEALMTMVSQPVDTSCPVRNCPAIGAEAHRRMYDRIEATEGRAAADQWDAMHAAWMECDDCGRIDGSHDPDVEH